MDGVILYRSDIGASAACVSGIRIQFANRCIFIFIPYLHFFISYLSLAGGRRENNSNNVLFIRDGLINVRRWIDSMPITYTFYHFISIFITQLEERSCHRHRRRRRRLRINYVHSLFEFFSISLAHTVSIAPLLTHNLHFMILFFSRRFLLFSHSVAAAFVASHVRASAHICI